jgi:cathepsin D
VVSNQTISGYLGTNASGIMGLAFSPVSRTSSVPFWQNLFNSNQLSQPLMSFWLTRYVNVTGARPYEYGGELTLGGTNSTLYAGDIEYQNLASNPPDYWSLQLTGEVHGHSLFLQPAHRFTRSYVGRQRHRRSNACADHFRYWSEIYRWSKS